MNEAELLFSEILNCDRSSLYLNKDSLLLPQQSRLVSSVLKRRMGGEPLQYILGKAEFMGLQFQVDPRVLIPRQETEILVEAAGKYLSEVSLPASRQGGHRLQVKVLDLGTGSGCIAITLAKQFPAADILACDISEAALEVASLNAGLHGVKIEFKKSDLFAACNLISDTCDLIVSNPPYIASGDFKDLQPEISYEPPVALNAGEDGLDLYRRIINEAPPYLKSRGFLLMELGFAQADPVKKIFHRKNNFKIIETVRDYNNIERVIVAQKEG